MKKITAAFIIIYITSSNNAFAYLDPGSGSIIIQIIAAIAGSFFIFFNYIKVKIKQFFKKNIIKKNDKKKKLKFFF